MSLSEAPPSRRVRDLLILLAGVVLGQVVLYEASLTGRKILLPLGILAAPGKYLPVTPGSAGIEAHNLFMQDLICVSQPARRFVASEFRAGRLHMWMSNY